MAALDEAVRAAIAGSVSPSEALARVASEWNEISDSLGRDAQRKAYVQSIGLRP
jgi:hypothetical protein